MKYLFVSSALLFSALTAENAYSQFQGDNSFKVGTHFHISPSGFVNGNLLFNKSWEVAGGIIRGFPNGGLEFLSLDNGWQTRMVIDYSGKIGIGTPAPSALLDINPGGSQSTHKRARIQAMTDVAALYVQNDGTGPIFETSNKFFVAASGAVGIGTTAPDSKLTVKGVIHAEEVKVDLNVPGPDYVFDESYPLRSLEDTKTFIDENKHLPGIPSSDEMQQNGVNLLEMNMKLLEKVEELTLHLIEMKRENEEQKQLNKKQQEQLEALLAKTSR